MSEGRVLLRREGPVAQVVFERPEARNAMTKGMYRELHEICGQLANDPETRVGVFRGAGGKAFVAGSDIGIFGDFTGAGDGVLYEAEMETYTRALAGLPFPTIAVIEGWAVGGGLNLAAACDIRIATPEARFGVPIARTVGNCLSIYNYARLVAELGPSRAKRMLMLGEIFGAEEMNACGFLAEVAPPEALEERLERLCERLLANAPVTMRVSKQAIARVLSVEDRPEAEDLIKEAYGSRDFRTGVAAFEAKTPPAWEGR